jgi:hypothetical protein
MNNCFSYSFIKCGTPASGERTLDAVFNTLSKLDLYSMFDNPQEAINKAAELAYNSMTSALLSKEGKSVNKLNEVLGQRFTDTYSNIQKYEFNPQAKQFIRLNKAWVNVQYTGTVNLKLVNELAVAELVPITVVSGVTTIVELNKDFKYVEVSLAEDVQGRTTYRSGMNGILLDYSILCDYNTFICANKDLFQIAMDYKVASILLTDGLFSGEINQRIMQDEDYKELKAEYETQYSLELSSLSIKESGCFDCGSRIQAKSWLV